MVRHRSTPTRVAIPERYKLGPSSLHPASGFQFLSTEIREYRDRMIADVVTGQVEVRGWQCGPDDVPSEDELAALGDDESSDVDEDESNGED